MQFVQNNNAGDMSLLSGNSLLTGDVVITFVDDLMIVEEPVYADATVSSKDEQRAA